MTKRIFKTGLAAFAVAACGMALTVSATQAQDGYVNRTDTSRKACFMANRVEGYAPVRFSTGVDGVNITDGKDIYQLKFANACPSIRDAKRIAVSSQNSSQYICTPTDTEVVAYGQFTPAEHCAVAAIKKFEKSELAAIPTAEQP